MKKTLFSILASTFIGGSMLAQTFGFFPPNNATTGSRGPNPGYKTQINCSNYAAADFGGVIPTGAQIVFVGWYLQGSGTATTVTNGSLQVYLENTSDAIYAKTSNTWTAITAPMTSVYNGTVAIPNSSTAAPYGVSTTPFNYTGNGLYVSFAYTNAGTLGSTTTHTYVAYSASGTATTTPMSKTAASTTSTVLPVSVAAAASVFKACIVLGYQMTGQEPGITYVTINGSNQIVNTGNVPVVIGLRNVGSTNVASSSYSIVADNGVSSQTITATPAINSSTTTVLTATLSTPTLAGLNNYTFTLNSSSDTYAGDNMGYGSRFFFPTKSVFMEDFNDTAKWKNVVGTTTLNAAVMPSGYSVINNDGGGTAGPYFIGSASNNPYFEGQQSISDLYLTANGLKIDDWLVTPQVSGYCSANIDSLYFYIKGTDPVVVDSVEILLASNGGNTVTDFTTSIAYIEAPAAAWTRFAYNLSPLLPVGTTNYRIAFRYKMGNGGTSGTYSNYFSLDCAHITRTNAVITSNAGSNQTVASTLVNLAGTSTGTITSSTWTQVSGPSATITSSTSLNTPITLTGGTGNYCFQLSVTDGCNTATSTVCVNASIATGITTADVELISINPNPAKDVICLNAASVKGTEISISIVSVDGRIVYSATTVAEEKMLINLQNLNTGIYFMNVSGKEFKQMTKLIKE